jgi:hypothetical protein|tara:strand:- start:1012 stop:1140 length:129 start_codon:yes stop_codon:yes gene_type:complete
MNTKAGYNNLARAALEGAGGTIIAIARNGAKHTSVSKNIFYK